MSLIPHFNNNTLVKRCVTSLLEFQSWKFHHCGLIKATEKQPKTNAGAN